MKKSIQLSLIKKPRKNTKLWWIEEKKVYGGSLNYRKIKRPFDKSKLNHVVFKARLGSGIWFTKSQKSIANLLRSSARRYRIDLKSFGVCRDHIHVLTWGGDQSSQVKFLRFFSAEMGRKYGHIFDRFGLKKRRNLWLQRPFSRQVSWGKKSLAKITNYIKKNRDEALGFIQYTSRKDRGLSAFLEMWAVRFNDASIETG